VRSDPASAKLADTPLNRADARQLLGIALLLGAFLMLTFTPQLLFEAWHARGYEKTEAEVLTAAGRSRSIRVRIASSGAEISIRRNTFDGTSEHLRIPVWYNADAILVAGITWLDARVVSVQRWPQLPQFGQALAAALINLLLLGAGLLLFLRRAAGRTRYVSPTPEPRVRHRR